MGEKKIELPMCFTEFHIHIPHYIMSTTNNSSFVIQDPDEFSFGEVFRGEVTAVRIFEALVPPDTTLAQSRTLRLK